MGKQYLYLLLGIILLSSYVSASTVHGTIYDSNLDTVNKIVVEVNSTPLQRHVSKYGGYSFELEPGTYRMVALASRDGKTVIVSEEYVEVTANSGDYNVDLFLFPGVNLTNDEEVLVNSSNDGFFSIELILWLIISALVVLMVFFVLLLVKSLSKKKKDTKAVIEYDIEYSAGNLIDGSEENKSDDKKEVAVNVIYSSEDDLLKKKILEIIEEHDGSILQKEIRKKTKLSESKISEVISMLVKEKKLAKLKKGRANLIIRK